MTENFYRTGTYNSDHRTYGGKISNYDFDGYNSLTDIASSIISDWKFDYKCMINSKNRERFKKVKK